MQVTDIFPYFILPVKQNRTVLTEQHEDHQIKTRLNPHKSHVPVKPKFNVHATKMACRYTDINY